MKIPNFLRELINSNEYADKNSDTYVRATKYMNLLYPGQAEFDSTGKMTEPPYDMTYEQFLEAQNKLKEDIENAIQEAEEDTEEKKGLSVDYSEFIETEETIDVRVLMPSGYIYNKKLVVYTLNIPEESHPDNPQVKKIWVWHSESDEFICDDCAAHDGELFENTDEIPELPVHPNCRCTITEDVIGPDGRTLSSKSYKPKTPTVVAPNTAEKSPNTPAEKATFEKPVNTKPGQHAVFDGKTLTLYQDGKPVMSWEAVSGNEGFQNSKFEKIPSVGPIPTGVYVARQEKLQHITPYGLVAGVANKGTWPGSLYSWGASRIRLEASIETNTYNRDGFYIHGGWELGSNGCIDLTSQMGDFTKWFETNGQDLIVNVKYN